MKSYEILPEEIEHDGKIYRLDLSYAAVFAAADALADERLTPDIKLHTALEILVPVKHPDDPKLLTAIFDLIKDERPRPKQDRKLMDIEQDWGFVCAGFQQAYGIDLYQDKTIHIVRFRALLEGLPKDTKLSEIIGIRGADIPAPTKYNQKQIADLTRLKTLYALRGSETSFQEGLERLYKMLSARAVKKNA